jgi:hypothetical protein
MYEGTGGRVAVHAPGLALLANHQHDDDPEEEEEQGGGANNNNRRSYSSNLLPGVPRVDEAGLTRAEYPGSGAITHYHNWTFYVQAVVIAPGEELLVRHHGRSTTSTTSTSTPPAVTASSSKHNNNDDDQDDNRTTTTNSSHSSSQRSVEWLRANGWCLDNTRPVHLSKYRQAGRGLVARRPLPAGAVVLPAPMRAIRRDSLLIRRHSARRRDDTTTTYETEQLLINYCFGHIDSSILFYSYGPMVKYVYENTLLLMCLGVCCSSR